MSQNDHLTRAFAENLDAQDPLARFRDAFHIPKQANGRDHLYFCGNSLGLQPKRTRAFVEAELKDWEMLGVEGHMHAKHPWMPYHEFLTKPMAALVGAQDSEVVVMNSLTVNLHLMMVSYYQPKGSRYKILIEGDAFPSDKYAVASQVAFHGYDPKDAVIELRSKDGNPRVPTEEILELIARDGDSIALIMIGGVNYYTGQVFDMAAITKAGHAKGCMVGFDLAHGAGNLDLKLHEWDVDFACWCSYKYLNSGPGGLSGVFVHDRHRNNPALPRFQGWWGHDKQTRFKMPSTFVALEGAEGWQLSNPPILAMAALRASLEVFTEAGGMQPLREKTIKLTGYLLDMLDSKLGEGAMRVITPRAESERGCQVSIQNLDGKGNERFEKLTAAGVIADWREPDVIRVAPVPLYNRFVDVWDFVEVMAGV